MAMNSKTVPVDRYVFDTLIRDLVGHERRPSAFLVYLAIVAQANGGVRARGMSHADLAEDRALPARRAECGRPPCPPKADRGREVRADRSRPLPDRGAVAALPLGRLRLEPLKPDLVVTAHASGRRGGGETREEPVLRLFRQHE